MGFAMTGLGRYNDALGYFDRVARLSEDDLEAKYGMAFLYHQMDRRIWARRKLDGILRVNPYHYNSLLLMATLKAEDGRLDDARGFIQKAIQSDRERPEGYIRSGMLYYLYYEREGSDDYLDEAVEEFSRAIAIQPENYLANRYMGWIALLQKRYADARGHFQKSLLSLPRNGVTLYNLALSHEKEGDDEKALGAYADSLKAAPSDDLAQSKIEDFLVLREFKMGHPLRVMYGKEHFSRSLKKVRQNLADEAVLHLRRSLYLNPVNREPREKLLEYYYTLGYYEFHVDELKDLLRLYPDQGYEERLNVAVIKRRGRLSYRAGFYDEPPPRDVPLVLVCDFFSGGDITAHPDAGEMMANYLTFALDQFGRQSAVPLKERLGVMQRLKPGEAFLGDNLETLGDMVRKEEIPPLRYVIYGNYREGNNHLSARYRVLDFKNGVVIDEFELSESGKDSVSRLSLRAAKRIFSDIPYEGRVLKTEANRIIVNLGLFDGVKPGDLLVMYRYEPSYVSEKSGLKKKLVFTVEESDTVVSSAKPQTAAHIEAVDVNEPIYPLTKRRARLIE
jgi:tetratricopeptide (TPR) repeat protein